MSVSQEESSPLPRKRQRLAEGGEDVKLAAQSLKADPIEGLSKNHDRAEWAAEAIHAFIARTGADAESAVQDVLTNLRHLCDRSGLDFEQELDCANRMYRQETEAGSGNPVR